MTRKGIGRAEEESRCIIFEDCSGGLAPRTLPGGGAYVPILTTHNGWAIRHGVPDELFYALEPRYVLGARDVQPSAEINSRQACSQRWHALAQMSQCSCIDACLTHSAPQALQAAAQVSRTVRVRLSSDPVWPVRLFDRCQHNRDWYLQDPVGRCRAWMRWYS